MNKAINSGIKRHREFMCNAEEPNELEVAFYAAKAYIAGCNDSGALDHEKWKFEYNELNILYNNLKGALK